MRSCRSSLSISLLSTNLRTSLRAVVLVALCSWVFAAGPEFAARAGSATVLAGAAFRDALRDGSAGPEMVRIGGGSFRMGSARDEVGSEAFEGPVRLVEVASFAIGRFEVTFAEYDAFARATGRILPDDKGWGRGSRPVMHVSFDDAQAYVSWLSEQTGHRYRLPTEAEWEYATRAGTTTPYWWGDEVGRLDANCHYSHCLSPSFGTWTIEVGQLRPNAFGLYDTAGNVGEWVEDCWHDDYDGAPADGAPWLDAGGGDCGFRVARGGSWISNPPRIRSASRDLFPPTSRSMFLGFRVARDL